VISVDYRMPPDAYFPAALDDAMTVWKATTTTHDPKKMAIFGSSAGGALTLEMVLRAKHDGLPLPAAIAPGTLFRLGQIPHRAPMSEHPVSPHWASERKRVAAAQGTVPSSA
jgi:acetyl esterase/lipase